MLDVELQVAESVPDALLPNASPPDAPPPNAFAGDLCVPADASRLSVSRLDSLDALAYWAAAWNRLSGDVPFRSYEWASCWWRHYAPAHGELFVLAVQDDRQKLVGLAPWYRSRSAGWGQTLQLLGSGEVCSDYLSLICREQDARGVSAALAEYLTGKARRRWHVLDMPAIDAADAALGHLREQLALRGHAVDCRNEARCWRLALPATWSEFLAGYSKSRRDRIRYLLRRHVESGKVKLLRAVDGESLERAFGIFVELHQKRRAMLGQPGCFASARFEAFHREVARQFLDSGRLRLVWLEFEGRPLAVEYGFVGAGTVYYYQGGFEPELADFCPGTLMQAVSLQAAIAEGHRQFDFLRGDEPYKLQWNAQSVPLASLRIAGGSPAARVRHSAWQTRESVKHWIRQRWSQRAGQAPPPAREESHA